MTKETKAKTVLSFTLPPGTDGGYRREGWEVLNLNTIEQAGEGFVQLADNAATFEDGAYRVRANAIGKAGVRSVLDIKEPGGPVLILGKEGQDSMWPEFDNAFLSSLGGVIVLDKTTALELREYAEKFRVIHEYDKKNCQTFVKLEMEKINDVEQE